MNILANKSKGFKFFAAACAAALIALVTYLVRNGDVLTSTVPSVTILLIAGIVLSVLMAIKDVKPLEMVPFVLYLGAFLIFLDTEINFVSNLIYGADGNSMDFGFILFTVCGLVAVVAGFIAAVNGIEKE